MNYLKVKSNLDLPLFYTGAVEYLDGVKEWRLNGMVHRLDGPARIKADGTKYWMINNLFHCTHGPAIERADGTKNWYCKGLSHREDGPANIYSDGRMEWCFADKTIYSCPAIDQCILIQEGMPCDIEWMGTQLKAYKVLTTRGIEFIPDLPGMRDILFARQ